MSKKVTNELKDAPIAKDQKLEKRVIKVQFELAYNGSTGKIMDQTVNTVPDMNLTVRQLLENHTRGANGDVQIKQPLYFDTEIPNLQDLTDVETYRNSLQNKLNDVQQFIADEQKQIEDAQKEAQTSKPSPSDNPSEALKTE